MRCRRRIARRSSTRYARRWRCRSRAAQVLIEERERARPGELRGGLVVARRRIVVESVLDAGIRVFLVANMVLVERLPPRGPAGIDALVDARVVDQKRRLDLCRIGGARLNAVERRRGGELGKAHGHHVDDAAAEAEADGTDAAVAFGA